MFQKTAIALFALLALTAGTTSVHAQFPPSVTGNWSNTVVGMGYSTWNFMPLGDGRYSATENGLGQARGIAVVTGNQLRIDFTANGGAGYYIVNLDASGATAYGTVQLTQGALAGRTYTVVLQRAGLPLAGRWSNTVVGMGQSTWTFAPLGNGRYSATETGLGQARGIAVLTGSHLHIDFSFNGGAGYYDVDLNADGTAGTGITGHTQGPSTGQTWAINFVRVGN